jgi:uncharacterized protein
MQNFDPVFYISNNHLQTLLGASKLRQKLVFKRSKNLLQNTKSILYKTSQDVRLQAEVTKAKNSNGKLAIVFHGWEGSANSAYVLGCSNVFYKLGYDVARLNFRDHGDTHHLNKSPFNSARLDEVCEMITYLSKEYPNNGLVFLGFSLGGNFALRLSTEIKLQHLNLINTIAVCPAIDPVFAAESLERGWFYHRHFLNKWRTSLIKKYRYYPEIMQSADDLKVKKMHKMNDFFVPLYTEFDSTEQYLSAYKITQGTLDGIKTPCHIIYADDDPLIHASAFDNLKPTANVHIYPQSHGGHCAFLKDWHLDSWIEKIIPAILQATAENPAARAEFKAFMPG